MKTLQKTPEAKRARLQGFAQRALSNNLPQQKLAGFKGAESAAPVAGSAHALLHNVGLTKDAAQSISCTADTRCSGPHQQRCCSGGQREWPCNSGTLAILGTCLMDLSPCSHLVPLGGSSMNPQQSSLLSHTEPALSERSRSAYSCCNAIQEKVTQNSHC